MADYVTLRDYDTVLDAKAAEQELVLGGITGVTRTGKKLKVDVTYESQARALLAGSATPVDAVANAASTAVDTASSAASTAVDTASSAATTVASTASNAVSTVADTASSAATTVADTAQQVASSAAETVQDAASAVTTQASKVTSAAADRVQDLADSIRQSGSSPDASGVQRQAAQTTAGVLEKTSQYIGPGGLQTLLGDVRSSIQSNPLRSLLIGLGVGYLLRARYFPAAPTPAASTPPAQPSTPTLQPTPPVPAASMQADINVPVSTSTDIAAAPLLETTATDTSLMMSDLDATSMLIGDDVLDADMTLGTVDADLDDGLVIGSTTTDFGDTGLDMSTGDSSTGLADTDLRTNMMDVALGDDIVDVDVLGSDTLMDDSLSADMLDTGSVSTTSIDATLSSMDTLDNSGMSSMGTPADSTFTSSSPTTPLSVDDLNTGTSLADDASSTGTTDLGDVLSRWDERTRGEGSQS